MMKQRVLFFLLAAVLVAGGFGAGLWTERHRPVPAPPAKPMAELTAAARIAPATPLRPAAKPIVNRAQLAKMIEQMGPQIEAYRAQVGEIDNDYERRFAELLSPAQRTTLAAKQQKNAESRAKYSALNQPDGPPLTDEEVLRLQQRPLYAMMDYLRVTGQVERAVRDYKLDEIQQARARDLLLGRREKFLGLLEKTPPPSLVLSRLAPVAQRLAVEAKK